MNRYLPLARYGDRAPQRWPELLTELQALGLRWVDPGGPGLVRVGGAGPSDHKAIRVAGQTVMVPIQTHASSRSPYVARVPEGARWAVLERDGERLGEIEFPPPPHFYLRTTKEGIPYWKIATLHASDVLATTVLQTCTRYGNRRTACQFCAIGQSLSAKRTIAEKTPEQLAEVARAAVELDGVRHMILTTGTPATEDRGAAVLCEAARAIAQATDLPMQAQCEPPADFGWFRRLSDAGIASLGMHLEAVTEPVRRAIMPGKAEVPISVYFEAFAAAVEVFGRGQVSTYILAGLGDPPEAIVEVSGELARLGVYPFVVPFVPIGGTPLEDHPTPEPTMMRQLVGEIAALLDDHGLRSQRVKAGCARCGACSTLRSHEALGA